MADKGVPIPPQQVLSAAAHPPLNGPLTPAATAEPAKVPPKPQSPPAAEHKDGSREIVETVVFVVVLVLLLKSFVAEAFVIPTGSMAETLWGYQKIVDCPKCRYRYPVNCSKEVDPQGGPKIDTVQATCPNCRHHIDFNKDDYPPSSGDRVLVAKFLYDLLNQLPNRHDVVVFKYPRQPQEGTVPKNYIKRLIGLPGETIAIYFGDLYRAEGIDYSRRERPADEKNLWEREYTYMDDEAALQEFRDGKFQIIRKPPKIMLAERRIVHDNDFQNPDRPRRWEPQGNNPGWTLDNPDHPRVFTGSGQAGDVAWLRYQHLLERDGKPELIKDFMGYNSAEGQPLNWVGDLMLECEVTVQEAAGELLLELSKGVDRFRARFDLAAGVCTLERVSNGAVVQLPIKKEVALKAGTKYTLRFANFDQRLTLWVNNTLPFDDGFTYDAASSKGPTSNDLEPASIGVQGAKVTVSHVRLWRDTYYTNAPGSQRLGTQEELGDPGPWPEFRGSPVTTMYVQPGHFLCLGDNSAHSSDGREWGLVPRRLLLGRALAVYYPFYFPYWPLSAHANRLGAIR